MHFYGQTTEIELQCPSDSVMAILETALCRKQTLLLG